MKNMQSAVSPSNGKKDFNSFKWVALSPETKKVIDGSDSLISLKDRMKGREVIYSKPLQAKMYAF